MNQDDGCVPYPPKFSPGPLQACPTALLSPPIPPPYPCLCTGQLSATIVSFLASRILYEWSNGVYTLCCDYFHSQKLF